MAASAAWASDQGPHGMFPITDLSRADDIRMRRRRAVLLLAGVVVLPLLFWRQGEHRQHGHAGDTDLDIDLTHRSIRSDRIPADEIDSVLHRIPLIGQLDWTVEGATLPTGRRDATALTAAGASLQITLSCARSITLVPQQDLSGRVFVSTPSGVPAAETGLRLVGSGAAMLLTETCRREPSDVVVQAPAGMPLTLSRLGDTAVRLGAFTGPIHLVLLGGGDAAVDAAGAAVIEKTGGGDVSIGSLNGDLQLSQRGSGNISIKRLQASRVSIVASGSGDIVLAAGHVDHLDASLHGSVDLSGDVAIGEASMQASEDCDVSLPHVSERRDRDSVDR